MKRLFLLSLLLAVSLWELCTDSFANFPSETLLPHESDAFELAFSADGEWLAADGNDHKIHIWDVSAVSNVHTLAGHEGRITGLAFRSNDELISASEDGTVRLWNVTEEREIRRYRAGLDQVTSIALSPDERQVVLGVTDGTLRLWEIDTGSLSRTFRGHVDVVLSVDFSSDGKQIASGSDDNTVRLWDVSSGTLVATFVGHEERVWSVAMHPDGDLIASGSWDGTVRLWNHVPATETADEDEGSNLPLATYDRPVLSVTFSPNARLLAVGLANSERDNSVKFWNVAGQNVARYQELRSFDAKSKHDLAFSPEGKLFAATGGDNTSIRVWRADPASPVPLSPRGETLVESPSTILQWQAAEDAIYYDIEVALDASFPFPYESATVSMNKLTFSLKIEGSQYWWRVRSGGFGSVSDWSEPSSFLSPSKPLRTCSVELIPQQQRIGLEEEFSVQVLADSVPDLAGFQFDLRWTDPDLLTFVTVTEFRNIFGTDGRGKRGQILQDEGLYKGVAATKIGEPNPDNSGILLEVLFRSKAVGTCKIQLENLELVNSDQGSIHCSVTETTVIVEGPSRPWDVNHDGVVDIFDLVIVSGFEGLANLSGLEINPDVNRDGVVNILDLRLVVSHFGETYENSAQAPGALSSEINTELSQATLRRLYLELIRSLDESPSARRAIQALEGFIISVPPRKNLLLQNYPNPFNPETWLPFQITATSDVSIHIYSDHGRLVRRIPLGTLPPGRYISRSDAAHWDGKNGLGEPVAAGMYFYTLSTETFRATKKMIVTK